MTRRYGAGRGGCRVQPRGSVRHRPRRGPAGSTSRCSASRWSVSCARRTRARTACCACPLPLGMTACYLKRDDFVLELLHFADAGTVPGDERVMNQPGLTHVVPQRRRHRRDTGRRRGPRRRGAHRHQPGHGRLREGPRRPARRAPHGLGQAVGLTDNEATTGAWGRAEHRRRHATALIPRTVAKSGCGQQFSTSGARFRAYRREIRRQNEGRPRRERSGPRRSAGDPTSRGCVVVAGPQR